MAGELRRVPTNWQHPKDGEGKHIPLRDGFLEDTAEREKELAQWKNGFCETFGKNNGRRYWRRRRPGDTYETCVSLPVMSKYYMLPYMSLVDSRRMHWQLYQTISEGTPITPAFSTLKALACWLYDADNGVPSMKHRVDGDEEFWNSIQHHNSFWDEKGIERARYNSYEDAYDSTKRSARSARHVARLMQRYL